MKNSANKQERYARKMLIGLPLAYVSLLLCLLFFVSIQPSLPSKETVETDDGISTTIDIFIEPPEETRALEETETIAEQEAVTEEPTIIYKQYWDVPLSESLQDYIVEVCGEYGIDPRIVIAVIKKESMYIPDVIGDNGRSYGLMQIQKRWHEERMARLGCTNLLDPFQNVKVGIDILAELSSTGRPIVWVLMAYNGGKSYADSLLVGDTISKYAATVLDDAATLPTYNKPITN